MSALFGITRVRALRSTLGAGSVVARERLDPLESIPGYGAQFDEKSWLVQLGFMQPPKPFAEGDFKVGTAVWLYSLLGAIFIAIGVGGIVLIVRASIQQ
ncbi:MAG: hypothetical protein ACHP79_07565 [Terriglobales bacterium]